MKKVIVVFLMIGVLSGTILSANSNSSDKININFKDLKIEDFVKMVAKITGKNILLSQNIKGSVNFISVKPIDKNQIYSILVKVLNSKGYTLRDNGSFLEVIRNSDATKSAPPLYGHSDISEIQTSIIGLKNLNVRTILRQINFLLSRYGKITLSYETNSIIVTDYPQNIRAIRNLAKRLDKKPDTIVEFIELSHASSKDVFSKISKITNSLFNKKIETQKVNVFEDQGTNSIIIVGTQEQIDKLSPYIYQLDNSSEVAGKRIEIVYVKNADANKIAATLNKLLSNKSFVKNIKTEDPSKKASKALEKTSKNKATPLSEPKQNKTSPFPLHDNNKPVVTVDEELNAVIVYAGDKEIKEIKALITQLDVEREQVYVQAKILEINEKEALSLGAKYGIGGGMITDSGLYGFSGQLGGSLDSIISLKNLLGTSFVIPNIKKALSLGTTISLLKNNNAANLISQPSLLCINNKESSMYVGQTQSVVTSASTGNSTTDLTRQSFTREDIGLTMKVKPRISADNKVVLEVTTILEDVLPNSKAGFPTTTKREVKTTAIVQNGETVIISGLVKNKISEGVTKIPLLGDIPLLGIPFRHKEESNDKVNLIIMLTPYIVKKSQDLSNIRATLGKISLIEDILAKEIEKKYANGENIFQQKSSTTRKIVLNKDGKAFEISRDKFGNEIKRELIKLDTKELK